MKMSKRVDLANTIILLNELRFKSKEYIEENGSYDKNMIQEIGLDEIIDEINELVEEKISFRKDIAFQIMDNIKERINWYKYEDEDGRFFKDGVHYD